MYPLVSNENLTVLISQSFQFGKLFDIGLITENHAEKKETVTGSFYKRGFLKKFFKGFQNPQKNTYLSQSLFFNKVAGVCWSLYLTSLRLYQRETPTHACNFIKKEIGTAAFLWILRNFQEKLLLLSRPCQTSITNLLS